MQGSGPQLGATLGNAVVPAFKKALGEALGALFTLPNGPPAVGGSVAAGLPGGPGALGGAGGSDLPRLVEGATAGIRARGA